MNTKKDKKKILLTGGSGFIGRNLTEFLNKKYNLLTPTHKELDFTDTLAVQNYLNKNKIDIIIHCAALGVTRSEKDNPFFLESNLRMFFNLVKCKAYYNRFILFGSGAEYDKSRRISNIKENNFDEKIPKNIYGFYKYVCSKFIENYNIDIVNLRLFGIFGKYEDYSTRFISHAICRAIFGLPIVIHQNVFFDYLYINDFFQIVDYFILNKPKYKFYNIGTGKRIDLLTIAKKIIKISGKNLEIIVENSGLNLEYTCDISRLKSEIKNLEFVNIDQSITELYKWYEDNKNKIDAKKL